MIPPSGDNAAWHYMSDAYGCSAWDVTPYVQVAGVCECDSVVLDGAYGASIRWKSFHPVGFTRLFSWRRAFASLLLQLNGWILFAGSWLLNSRLQPFIQLAKSGGVAESSYYYSSYYYSLSIDAPGLAFAVLLLLLAIVTFFRTPGLIRLLLGGQFRSVEAALFGIEGYMDPATAERTIFGCASGRMTWSPNGSPLSRSRLNERRERVGVDPLADPTVREKVELAKVAMPGSKRVWHHVPPPAMFRRDTNGAPLDLHTHQHIHLGGHLVRGRAAAHVSPFMRCRRRHAARHRVLVRLYHANLLPGDSAAHEHHGA